MLAAKPLITNAKRPRESLVLVANLTRKGLRERAFVARRFGVFNASPFKPFGPRSAKRDGLLSIIASVSRTCRD